MTNTNTYAYLGDYYPRDSTQAVPLRIDTGAIWRWHRDNTVTIWDVSRQRWARLPVSSVPDHMVATLNEPDRLRVMEAQRNG